jgi:glycosyltransferase involved in cell wall biosynthesis
MNGSRGFHGDSVRFSVVVPVYNEAHCIAAHASALLDDLAAGQAEVVFVCNGCTDDTEAILRETIRGRCLLLTLAVAGKANAIRHGEARLTLFPRFYVDADVMIRGAELAMLAERLGDGCELISPTIEFGPYQGSWAARAVNDVWLSLPHAADAGFHHVLAVSEQGRRRWNEFPDLIADDTFIAGRIPRDRRRIARDIMVTTYPPASLASYIRVRARWARGTRELAANGYPVDRHPGQRRRLLRLALAFDTAIPTVLYVCARLVAAFLALLPSAANASWYRDHTSREVRSSRT